MLGASRFGTVRQAQIDQPLGGPPVHTAAGKTRGRGSALSRQSACLEIRRGAHLQKRISAAPGVDAHIGSRVKLVDLQYVPCTQCVCARAYCTRAWRALPWTAGLTGSHDTLPPQRREGLERKTRGHRRVLRQWAHWHQAQEHWFVFVFVLSNLFASTQTHWFCLVALEIYTLLPPRP